MKKIGTLNNRKAWITHRDGQIENNKREKKDQNKVILKEKIHDNN